MLSEPGRVAVECLADRVEISCDHHNKDSERIARAITLTEAMRFMLRAALSANVVPRLAWPQACTALSSSLVRGVLRTRNGIACYLASICGVGRH